MKKIFIWHFAVVLLLCVMNMSVCAADSSAHMYESTVKVQGESTPYSDVTLLLFKDTATGTLKNSDIKHVEQVRSDEDGLYNVTFRYTGNVDGLTLKVLEKGTPINKYIECKAFSDVFVVSAKTLERGGNLIVTADEFNEFDLKNITYNVMVAFYDENARMTSVKIIDGNVLKNNGTFEIEIPKDTAYRKVFAWTETLIPVAREKVQDNLNPIFNNADKEETVVALIGDSLTHHNAGLGSYKQVLENYYLTRYPGKKITFENKGVGGAGVSSVLPDITFFNDILDCNGVKPDYAIVMFGMNYKLQFDTIADYSEAISKFNSKEQVFEKDTIELINKLKANGVTPIIMSSTLYDTDIVTSTTYPKSTNTYTLDNGTALTIDANMQLEKQAEFLKNYCEENNILYIPMWELSTQYTKDIRSNTKNSELPVFTQSDGIHPIKKSAGAYLLGALCAYEHTQNDCVSDVVIDAAANKITAKNADVTDLTVIGGTITYKYSPKSLPLAANDPYNEIETTFKVNITEMINNETITIKNLDEGNYALKIDSADLGTYSAQDLAGGVNIAANKNNPLQIISKEVFNKLDKMNDLLDTGVREYKRMRVWMVLNEKDPDKVEDVESYYYNQDKTNDKSEYQAKIQNYYNYQAKYSAQVEEANTLYDQARALCESGLKDYTVTIVKQ